MSAIFSLLETIMELTCKVKDAEGCCFGVRSSHNIFLAYKMQILVGFQSNAFLRLILI